MSTEVNKRGLLIGLGALLAAPAIVRATNLMPIKPWYHTLVGDGVIDDSVALQAYVDGEKVWYRNTLIQSMSSRGIDIPKGQYLLTNTLDFDRSETGVRVSSSETSLIMASSIKADVAKPITLITGYTFL